MVNSLTRGFKIYLFYALFVLGPIKIQNILIKFKGNVHVGQLSKLLRNDLQWATKVVDRDTKLS